MSTILVNPIIVQILYSATVLAFIIFAIYGYYRLVAYVLSSGKTELEISSSIDDEVVTVETEIESDSESTVSNSKEPKDSTVMPTGNDAVYQWVIQQNSKTLQETLESHERFESISRRLGDIEALPTGQWAAFESHLEALEETLRKMAARNPVIEGIPHDEGSESTPFSNLRDIAGIGPKTARILKLEGLNTILDLANVSDDELIDVSKLVGRRYDLVDRWRSQAKNSVKDSS